MVRYRLLRGKKGKAAVVLAAYPCVALCVKNRLCRKTAKILSYTSFFIFWFTRDADILCMISPSSSRSAVRLCRTGLRITVSYGLAPLSVLGLRHGAIL